MTEPAPRPPDEPRDAREHALLEEVEHLAEQERALRAKREALEVDEATERAEVQRIEERRDQVWDLIRQRRALAESGQDPDMAQERPVEDVESYRQ